MASHLYIARVKKKRRKSLLIEDLFTSDKTLEKFPVLLYELINKIEDIKNKITVSPKF